MRVPLTWQQIFSLNHRPETIQTIKLAADDYGTLQSVRYRALGEIKLHEDYAEVVVNWSSLPYECKNMKLDYELARTDGTTPNSIRASSSATSLYAFEIAIGELAVKAGRDPLEFCRLSYAERD